MELPKFQNPGASASDSVRWEMYLADLQALQQYVTVDCCAMDMYVRVLFLLDFFFLLENRGLLDRGGGEDRIG